MIDILMATYNGEKYIQEQIESIISQTYTKWRLYIRDDGSVDGTVQIVDKYVHQYPEKIIRVEHKDYKKSAKLNFAELIYNSDGDYIMCCDQDDIWVSTKIELTLNKMKILEKQYGKKTVLLVHTDLKVVNENLHEISNSMFKMQKLDKKATTLNKLVVQNSITGCTMMFNKELKKRITRMPNEMIMHDWWIGLIASSFGHIGFVDMPTILYRQHNSNAVGVKNVTTLKYMFKKYKEIESMKKSLDITYDQAVAFLDMYKNQISTSNQKILERYSSLRKMNKYDRIKVVNRYKFFKYGLARRIGQIYCIMSN